MRILKALSLVLLIASLFSSLSFAAQQDRISGSLSNGQSHVLKGNIRHQALPEYDQGRVDPGMHLGTITLMTAPTAAQESAIKLLLAQQQDRKTPNYHKWLTPEQYADRFGLSQNDMQQMVAWLASQGFTMIQPARARNFITFTGTAAQVESGFGTEIHRYQVKGESHYANAIPPQIPAALTGIVVGVHGLDDFRLKAMNVKRARPNYYSSALQSQFIAPGDIYTMYDINPLLNATPTKIDGTGQKVAIVGETEIYQSDINDFRTGFGLSSISCTAGTIPNDIITACADPHFSYLSVDGGPGEVSTGDLPESDLDLEWSGAIAPGAQIVFVTSGDVYDSLYYAIDNKVAPVISMSYGDCEFRLNIATDTDVPPGYSTLWEPELQAANLAGITVVNSSGDSGAAECDVNALATENGTLTATGLATWGLAVSYPASSPEVTGVGGTAIPLADLTSTTYFGTTNGTSGGSALSYVPEQAWNDDDEFVTLCLEQSTSAFCENGAGNEAVAPPWVAITSEATAQRDVGIGSSGGGASNCYMQNTGLTACVSGFPQPDWQTVTVSGQTTRLSPDISLLASADFPGFVYCTQLSELGDPGTGSSCAPGGAAGIASAVDPNFSLVGGTSVSAPMFAGMVALLNQYTASTGQGNINVPLYQLAKSTPSAFHDITSGDNNVACEPGTYAGQPAAMLCPSTGVIGYSAGTGFDLATGLGSVDVNNLAVALFTLTSPFTLAPTAQSFQVTQGASVNATVTVTINGSFTGTITFTCNDPAPESICTAPTPVTAATLPANGQVSFNISTTAPTASLRPPNRGTGIFYAALLPGLFGLMLMGGTRRRSLRGMRFLGLILVMGFSTLWLASCGGSSGGNSNQGTPVNDYTITVSATSGGATVNAPSFSLDVVQ
jgi:subtilase family serine protease